MKSLAESCPRQLRGWADALQNTARDHADQIARRYAQIIKQMPADQVSDALKVNAGIPIPKKRRKWHFAPPRTFPRLYIDRELTGKGLLQITPSVWLRFGIDPRDPSLHSVGAMFRGQWLDARGEVGPMGPAQVMSVRVRGTSTLRSPQTDRAQPRLKLAA